MENGHGREPSAIEQDGVDKIIGVTEVSGERNGVDMPTDRNGAEVGGVPMGELVGRMRQAEISGISVSELGTSTDSNGQKKT